jgi:hypothetical protein
LTRELREAALGIARSQVRGSIIRSHSAEFDQTNDYRYHIPDPTFLGNIFSAVINKTAGLYSNTSNTYMVAPRAIYDLFVCLPAVYRSLRSIGLSILSIQASKMEDMLHDHMRLGSGSSAGAQLSN